MATEVKMKPRKLKHDTVTKIAAYIILILVSCFFLFPFLILITTSFKTNSECYQIPITVFPKGAWTLEAYEYVFDTIPFFTYLLNSLFIALMSMLGALFSCPLVAYSLSRLHWKGRDGLFITTLAVMMIPGAVTMVPTYLLYNSLNMVGTHLPLFIGSFFGGPFYIFMLRQFFMGLPKSLEEAATIDGCTKLGVYCRIFLPLMKPALSTIAVLQLSGAWNDFMGPLIYLSEQETYTLQIGLQQFKNMFDSVLTSQMAASLLVTIPLIILFFFAQKQFTEGMTFSGTKG